MQLDIKFIGLLLLSSFLLEAYPVCGAEYLTINRGVGPEWINSSDTAIGGALFGLAAHATGNQNGIFVDGYTNLGSGDIYFALYEDMQIRAFNLSQKMFLGSWSMGRTVDDSQQNIANLSAANERDQEHTESDFMVGSENAQALGCLWNYPLRYGDIDGDGQMELALLPGKGEKHGGGVDARLDFAIFSLQSHAAIFSTRLAREASGGPQADFDPNYKSRPNYGALPQLIDAYYYNAGDAAMRYYAKLYFGDFDGNGKQDIIAWRKRYDSRPISDPVQGYKLTAQLLTHYEFVDGAYKAQTTDEDTIKGWLAAKNLTWQKGYPDVSECPGEEGKPIPETVDPLLNDPDVLQ